MMKVLLAFFVSALALNLAQADSKVVRVSDVSYLGPDRQEKMDVYLPPDSFEGPAPAVLLIHGGGWRVGDKASKRERNFGNTLAANGYTVFSINYELNVGERDPKTGKLVLSHLAWPQNLYDCKSALRYLRLKAQDYGIDPDKIAVMGGSAGGHLSMMVGATANDERKSTSMASTSTSPTLYPASLIFTASTT